MAVTVFLYCVLNMPYCPICGSQVKEETRFCPNCGCDLKASIASQPQYRYEQAELRPTGVTILAVLQVLGGIVFFGLGVLLMAIAGLIGIVGLTPGTSPFPILIGSAVVGIIGIIMLAIGILGFAAAYGFWNGLGWSWTVGIAIAVIGVIITISSLPHGILGLAIEALILYYLTRPYVKRWFRK
jgi:multisubunit Na+/H+ antiporter MnhG subunit